MCEQCDAIKCFVKLGKSPTEALSMLRQAYREAAQSHSTDFEWQKFREGREEVNDDARQNAPAHSALSGRQFLAEKSITQFEHPPYSSGLAPRRLLTIS